MRPLALALALVTLALAPAASAGTIVDRAASGLRAAPVYLDPDATQITRTQAASLRREIESRADGPVYIAILPAAALAEAGGSAVGIVDQLQSSLGRRGVYAVVAGNQFRAESTDLGRGQAGKLATRAFDAHHTEGAYPTLVDFVDRVGANRNGGGNGGGSHFGFWPIIIVGGALFLVYRSLSRRRRGAADFRAVKEAAREDLVALADDVQQLEHRVEQNPAAKHDYLAALEKYGAASSAFDRASSLQQLAPVAESLEEGRYLMASAEARLDGRDPPERRPACFFDPRHGPSVRDVEWAPPGGQTREVPACAACATRVEDGEEPESRQVLVGGRATPYWAAGPMYGGYFGGFFPGLLLGELFAGFGGFGGFGWGSPYVGDGSGVSDFDGGGDFGDFGGGDFGGGDGGGGDF